MPIAPVPLEHRPPTWKTYWDGLPPGEADAKLIRLLRKALQKAFPPDFIAKATDLELFTYFHAVCARIVTCVSNRQLRLARYSILKKIAAREHGLKESDFRELVDLLHRSGYIEKMKADEAPKELRARYEAETGRQYNARGIILLSTGQGRTSTAQYTYFTRRIMADRCAQPVGPHGVVTREDVAEDNPDERVYRLMLYEDAENYPYPPKPPRKRRR